MKLWFSIKYMRIRLGTFSHAHGLNGPLYFRISWLLQNICINVFMCVVLWDVFVCAHVCGNQRSTSSIILQVLSTFALVEVFLIGLRVAN